MKQSYLPEVSSPDDGVEGNAEKCNKTIIKYMIFNFQKQTFIWTTYRFDDEYNINLSVNMIQSKIIKRLS